MFRFPHSLARQLPGSFRIITQLSSYKLYQPFAAAIMSNAAQSNSAAAESRKSRVVTLPPVSLLSNISAEPFVDTHAHLHYVLEKLPDSFGLTSLEALKEDHFPKNLECVINVLCEPESFYPDLYPGTFRDWRVMACLFDSRYSSP